MLSENQENLEQNKREAPMTSAGRTAVTGLFGGVFWSLLAYLAFLLNFTSIGPGLILNPWAVGDWKSGTLGHIIGICVIGLLSILAAFAYYALLRGMKSIWAGIFYGAALWALVFFLLNPIFPDLKAVGELGVNTIVTTVCFYILYGVFIGYSISYENNEVVEAQKESGYSNN